MAAVLSEGAQFLKVRTFCHHLVTRYKKVRTSCPKVRTFCPKVRTSCPKVRTNLREGEDRMAYYSSITSVQTAEETPGHDKGFAKAHRY